jgi:hypothetical protein
VARQQAIEELEGDVDPHVLVGVRRGGQQQHRLVLVHLRIVGDLERADGAILGTGSEGDELGGRDSAPPAPRANRGAFEREWLLSM